MLDFARGRLGASAAAALFAEGREMTAEDAAGLALGSAPEPAEPRPADPVWADPARSGGGTPARGPLTPREREIAMLIAQGLSNREIADELVISPATAARHVANILAKLGFSSRTQVASWATRHEPPG